MKRWKLITLCILVGLGLYVGKSGMFLEGSDASSMIQIDKQEVREVTLTSEHAVLIDQNSGEILLNKKGDERIAPASLTKIMSVHVALAHINNLQDTAIVPEDIFPTIQEENASMAGFLPHERVTMEDLLHGALLSSGADSCLTLAVALCGNEEAFVKLMNQEAKRIGMKNTHFTNCTGLDDDQHYSTAEDLALLLKVSLEDEIFAKIFHEKNYAMVSNLHPDGLTLTSTLWQTMANHSLSSPYIMGGKTGFTNHAGLCLASQGTVDKTSYIFVSAEATGDFESDPFHVLDAIKVYEMLANEIR